MRLWINEACPFPPVYVSELYSAAGQVPGSGKTHPNFRIPENRPDVNAPFTAGIV